MFAHKLLLRKQNYILTFLSQQLTASVYGKFTIDWVNLQKKITLYNITTNENEHVMLSNLNKSIYFNQ